MGITRANLTLRFLDARLTSLQKELKTRRRVFKFLHDAAELPVLHQGSIRLGTARKFWDIENLALQDKREGQITTHIDKTVFRSGFPLDASVHPSSPFYAFAKSFVGTVAHGDISFDGFVFQTKNDFYMYSFSYKCSPSVVHSFKLEPFDLVAEIIDIYGLAETLVELHPKLKGYVYCIYPMTHLKHIARRPDEQHPNPLKAMYEKDEFYKNNEEGGIVFFKLESSSEGTRVWYDLERLDTPDDFSHPEILKWFTKGKMPLSF